MQILLGGGRDKMSVYIIDNALEGRSIRIRGMNDTRTPEGKAGAVEYLIKERQ